MIFQTWWAKVPESIQTQIVSGAHTFFAAFIIEILATIQMGGNVIPTGREALLALFGVAIRAGTKALFTQAEEEIIPKKK